MKYNINIKAHQLKEYTSPLIELYTIYLEDSIVANSTTVKSHNTIEVEEWEDGGVLNGEIQW